MVPTSSSPNPVRPVQSYRKRKYLAASSDNDFSDDEGSPQSGSPSMDEDRRAHHNELERRRRDHIKDHFMALKGSIPLLEGEKSSRALILKRAVDYIKVLQNQVKEYKTELEDAKRRNENLVQSVGLKSFLPQIQLQQQPIYTPPQPQQVLCVPSTSLMPSSAETLLNQPINQVTVPCTQSPQTSSPVTSLNIPTTSPAVMNNLSSLLLQNPQLLAQLQQQRQLVQPTIAPTVSSMSPPAPLTTSPTSNYSLPDLVDAQARLLANSLALRERQFAAVAAAHF